MTLAARRARTRTAILDDPARSDRSISRGLFVSRELASRVRADLLRSGEIQPAPVRGADGKLYRYVPRPRKTEPRVDAVVRRLNKIAEAIQAPEFAEVWSRSPVSVQRRLSIAAFQVNTEAARLRRQT